MRVISQPIPLALPSGALPDTVIYSSIGTVAILVILIFMYVLFPALGLLPLLGPSYGLLMAISVYFAVHVLLEPRMALLYAPLFMILAASILPQTFPQAGQSAPPEYFCWAVGLCIVTISLVLRLPWGELLWRRKRHAVPVAFAFFLIIAISASLQGLRLGASLSHTVRQLFGAALFCTYFYAAITVPASQSDFVRYFRILKWFGMAASVYTVIRYRNLPGNIDSFKWGLSIYCAMLAVYCMAEAATAKGLLARVGLFLQAVILIVNPLVFRARAATSIAALAGVLAFVTLLKSRAVKTALMICIAALALAAVAGDALGPVLMLLPHFGNARATSVEDILADPSFIGRVNQLLSSIDVIRVHPFLGQGLGSSLVYFDPSVGRIVDLEAIDQGVAYILSKLGLLGLVSLSALAYSVVKHSGWPERSTTHIAAFVLFIFSIGFMLSHPVMLQFIGAGFVGIIAGLLYRVRSLRPALSGQALS